MMGAGGKRSLRRDGGPPLVFGDVDQRHYDTNPGQGS